MRQTFTSGYPTEEEYGYARAVKVGNMVFLSGTTARNDALDKDVYGQARDALDTIEKALGDAGASLRHVVKTVAYLTDMDNIDGLTRAHREAFLDIRPASTVVEIKSLSPATALVELDIIAVIDDA